MSKPIRRLTWEDIQRAIDAIDQPLPQEYIFQLNGRSYIGPNYGECVMAAMWHEVPEWMEQHDQLKVPDGRVKVIDHSVERVGEYVNGNDWWRKAYP